jgi:hypothetical protein
MYLHENNSKKSQKALKKLGRSWGKVGNHDFKKNKLNTQPSNQGGGESEEISIQSSKILCLMLILEYNII